MVSPNRMHNKNSFFKYMPSSTAELVLENSTLRWSSPLTFNDPFDVPREMMVNISPREIQTEFVKKLETLIDEPSQDTSNLSPKIKLIIDSLRKKPRQALKREVIDGMYKDIENNHPPDDVLFEIKQLWQSWLPNFRIICLSEHHDKASMWYHYADKYKGVVLELICNDELDSPWLMAKKVEYPVVKPHIYTAEGWAELLLKPFDDSVKAILHTCSYTKSPDWSYEDEWRISSFKRKVESGLTTDYKVAAQEFGNLYLGPHIQEETREKLLELAVRYPNIKAFDTQIGLDREFKFTEI
jgi:hypothetical protein